MSLDILTKNGGEPPQNEEPSSRKMSMTWLLPVGLLLGFLLILGLLFGARMLPAADVHTAPVVTVRGGEASATKSGTGQMLFQASGWVEPDPYTTYVPALINGIVDRVEVLEGTKVKKGQLLATLIDDDQKLLLQAAEQKCTSMQKKIDAHCKSVPIIEAQIAASEKNIEAGKSLLEGERDNLKRLESIGGNAVSEQSIVKARFTVARHEALVAMAQAEQPELFAKIDQIAAEKESMLATLNELKVARDQAELALSRTKIHAPIDGIVLHLHAAPGKKRMLQMDDPTSSVVVELYDPQQLQARIDVPLTEAAGLGVGQKVELVSDLLANKKFSGTVTRISGQADLQRNTLQAKVEIHQPDERLRPDMLLRAKFFAQSTAKEGVSMAGASTGRLALYMPKQALIDGSKAWVVSTESKAELRNVEVSTESRDGHIRVLSGLKSGERVILPPFTDLAEGDRVETKN